MKSKSDLEKIKAIIDGVLSNKTIQEYNTATKEWYDIDGFQIDYTCLIDSPGLYKVKPAPKYTPFESAEECIEECKKHEPFGYIRNKVGNVFSITGFYDKHLRIGEAKGNLTDTLTLYTFLDDSKFGKITE